MNCEACGHEWHIHSINKMENWPNPPRIINGLCEACYYENGECYPWEFR